MKLAEIEKKARQLGIKNVWSYSRTDLVKAIQRQEGNFDCFGTANNYCDQFICCWRDSCFKN